MRVFLLLSLMVPLASAKVYTENELANRLKSHRTPEIIRTNYETWLCIARNKSGYNTSVVDYSAQYKSTSYGIFQISNDGWCKDWNGLDQFVSHCGNNCSNFIDEDITDDLDCVANILEISGIKAWGSVAEDCSEDDDFWFEGACVFPESFGKEDPNTGEFFYPCDDTSLNNRMTFSKNSQFSSTAIDELVVIKRNETKCYGNINVEYQPRDESVNRRSPVGEDEDEYEDDNGEEEDEYEDDNEMYRYKPVFNGGSNSVVGKIGHNSGKGLPTCEPIAFGCDDPDFISDGCSRNEIKMEEDGPCYGVLSNGPCGIDGIVLVHRTTKMGYCATRRCSPDRVLLVNSKTDEKTCHDPREPGLCQRSDHILYRDMYGDPICGCREGYYEKNSKCHQVLTETDICPKGEVFWFKSFRGYPSCLPDPCKGDNINRAANQLPFVPYKDGKCYQIASQPLEICESDEFYFLDMEKLEGDCEEIDEAGFIVYTEEEFDKVNELYGSPLHHYHKLNSTEMPTATRSSSVSTILVKDEYVQYKGEDEDEYQDDNEVYRSVRSTHRRWIERQIYRGRFPRNTYNVPRRPCSQGVRGPSGVCNRRTTGRTSNYWRRPVPAVRKCGLPRNRQSGPCQSSEEFTGPG